MVLAKSLSLTPARAKKDWFRETARPASRFQRSLDL